MVENNGYIGVDLDGTLAEYTEWKGFDQIGDPVPRMVFLVKGWLREGREVRIVTARDKSSYPAIHSWCKRVFGRELPITNQKTFGLIALYDDRAEAVVPNTGVTHRDLLKESLECLKMIKENVDEFYFGEENYEKFLDLLSSLEEVLS